MTSQRALIFGITGQDGAYLARFLLRRGYEVHGTARQSPGEASNLSRLSIGGDVRVHPLSPLDAPKVEELIRVIAPAEIYYLAGQASVALSFTQPVEAISSHAIGALNMLEAVRTLGIPVRVFNASSSEIFGSGDNRPATENTPVAPRTPYGVAKAASTAMVATYRESYGLFACSGILFPHESPLRPASYVTSRIVNGTIEIAQGRGKTLQLGNLAVVRDWGWAADSVDCMWRMLQQDQPRDFVIATGVSSPLESFVDAAFRHFGLHWREHVTVDQALLRPSDVAVMVGDPGRARAELGWSATVRMPELADRLVRAALSGSVD